MKSICPIIIVGCIALLPAYGEYTFFADDFESASPAGPNVEPVPLIGNGMLVGANVFHETNVFFYNYFSFPAPNITGDGARFCNIAGMQGGPDQGAQVLSVFNDYNNNGAHEAGGETAPGSMVYTAGDLVNALVFVEYVVEAADLGTTVTFEFDAKIGDFLAGPIAGSNPAYDAEAEAFVTVLNSLDNSFNELVADKEDASMFPVTWETYSLSIFIDPAWEGQLLQAGFRTKTSNYAPSGVFYDNVSLTSNRVEVVDPGPTIISTSWAGDVFTVDFFGKDGFEYTLWKADSIEGPYDDAVDFIEGSDAIEFVSDADATDPNGFYKLGEDPTAE